MKAEPQASRWALTIVALAPLWISLPWLAAPRTLSGGMGTHTVNIAGVPAGIVMLLFAASLTLVGIAAVRSWKRPLLGILLFTLPAAALVVFGPALVLMLENLGRT